VALDFFKVKLYIEEEYLKFEEDKKQTIKSSTGAEPNKTTMNM